MAVSWGTTAVWAMKAPEGGGQVAMPDDELVAARPIDLSGVLYYGDFQATALAHRVTGTLLWLVGPEDVMRVEMRADDAADEPMAPLMPLLNQYGEGWTVVLAGPGRDTFNAWGQEWRRPPGGLRELAHLVAEALTAGPGPLAPAPSRWRPGSLARRGSRHLVSGLVDPDSAPGRPPFRDRLVRRGGGRAATEDLVELNWQNEVPDRAGWLQVRASGRPGTLSISAPRSQRIVYAMPEAFVPLWPLADLIDFGP